MGLIWSILLGALAGWIAGRIMGSKGGFLYNVLLGILGGAVGGWLAGKLGIGGGRILQLIISVIGACIVVSLARLIVKKH